MRISLALYYERNTSKNQGAFPTLVAICITFSSIPLRFVVHAANFVSHHENP